MEEEIAFKVRKNYKGCPLGYMELEPRAPGTPLPLRLCPFHTLTAFCIKAWRYTTKRIYSVFQKELYICIVCYCVASVAETFTLKGVQTIHRSTHSNIWNTIAKFFFKHPALPVEVTLNRNYPR
jgi:hypothetical protein